MNRQEVFDIVAKHLLQQKTRSIGYGHLTGMCVYRRADGHRCAIGALIPDDMYDPEIESVTIDKLLEYADYRGISFPLRDAYIAHVSKVAKAFVEKYKIDIHSKSKYSDVSFLKRLQDIHDKVPCDPAPGQINRVQSLLLLADDYGLSPKVIDEHQASQTIT